MPDRPRSPLTITCSCGKETHYCGRCPHLGVPLADLGYTCHHHELFDLDSNDGADNHIGPVPITPDWCPLLQPEPGSQQMFSVKE